MTDRYAVIGNPIGHSRSPAIHEQFARQTGQDIRYERLLAPLDGFEAAVHAFAQAGGRGLNVTVPFKAQASALAQRRSARVQAAGAANTLSIGDQGIAADNTDGLGLVNDLRGRFGLRLTGMPVILLGAGGAASGVVMPLLQAGVAQVLIVNRSVDRAEALVAHLSSPEAVQAAADEGVGQPAAQPVGRQTDAGPVGRPPGASMVEGRLHAAGFDALSAVSAQGALLINATSAGLSDARLPVPEAVFAASAFAYDMVYGAAPTAFLTRAAACGCPRLADGLGMLVEQAAQSFLIWRGVMPETEPVYRQLREQLGQA